MAVFGAAALQGLGAMGNGLMGYFQQQQSFQNQKELLEMSQQFSASQQTNYQDWYQNYMTDLTQQKFNNSMAQLDYQTQLKAMNTPSALMASHGSYITNSDGSGHLTSGFTSLYPGVLSGGIRNQASQAGFSVEPVTEATDTSIPDGNPFDERPMIGNSNRFTSGGAVFGDTNARYLEDSVITNSDTQTPNSVQTQDMGTSPSVPTVSLADETTDEAESNA